MKLSFLFFGNRPDEKWELCKQMGIRFAIAKLSAEHTGHEEPWKLEQMQGSKKIFAENGFELIGLEGDQFDMTRIKFGLEGRDEDLDRYCEMLESMGQLGISLLCYNFMAGIGWYRTNTSIETRGGAKVTGFNWERSKELQAYQLPRQLTQEDLWNNYQYFLERVLPVAEKAKVKMALHPDDPPVSMLMGIPRIFTDSAAIRKAMAIADSPSHGITFCQGTYITMQEDVPGLINEFGKSGRIHFIHIRDVRGSREDFEETFHDDGSTDMAAMFKLYQQYDTGIPLRSDHVPTMAGEDNEQPGYGMKGNLFGIGYIKGLMDALGIQQE